ncbi:hypothetical protein F3P66_08860 [Agrobacterium fabrum]|uniref:Uncharacterized protein n=1 Tax=Agrobacterium fabrum (strain C58 / ATCC 33970) TaxID=176299 RepID=Q8UGE6_AGRFC|nr:hypothetical protein Atu1092 [Agrobacterium fabrum str. C58]QRM59547.1 hypothetical protein F3P66_08860 [Agrobacterium fabrum]TRB30970.1 hypothetical protein EXN51_02000 [Agrobacterium fabrum]
MPFLRFVLHPATALSLNDCSWLGDKALKQEKRCSRRSRAETREAGKTLWFLLFRYRNQPSVQPPANWTGCCEQRAYTQICPECKGKGRKSAL